MMGGAAVDRDLSVNLLSILDNVPLCAAVSEDCCILLNAEI